MQLKISRELLLQTLTAIANAVDSKASMAVLANIKFELSETSLVLTASDLEVELVSTLTFAANTVCVEAGSTTLPARKLMEICKKMKSGSSLTLTVQDNAKCAIKTDSGRYTLGVLSADDYPVLGTPENATTVGVQSSQLKNIIDKTMFAMAKQDVRFYLTGMLFEAEANEIRTVATDGHRLAVSKTITTQATEELVQVVVPRKAVSELTRLLITVDDVINLTFGREFFQVQLSINENFDDNEGESLSVCFTSRLIDGKYPDYRRVMPSHTDKVAEVDREILKQVLGSVSILSHEKSRGIIFDFLGEGKAQIRANNAEQDEGLEDLPIEYNGEPIELSFNSLYLLDVVNVLPNKVRINMTTATSSVLINEADDADHQYVIMPMRI